MDDVEKLNIDSIIARLLEVRNSKPGKNVQLAENEIRGLCLKSRELFLSQPILLELEAPLKICGIYITSLFFVLYSHNRCSIREFVWVYDIEGYLIRL